MKSIQTVTSASNPRIRLLKSLQTVKGRRESGLFPAEGLRLTSEIRTPWEAETVVLSDSFWEEYRERLPQIVTDALAQGRDVLQVPDTLFQTICETQHPQGILAAVRRPEFRPEDIARGERPFLIALENVQDPGNAGTILRTADAAGADGVLLSKGCVDIYSPKAVRASMGSVFHIPAAYTDDFPGTLRRLQADGIRVFAAYLDGSRSLYDADLSGGSVILIGNEGNGLSADIAALADERIRIPQPGRAESLNASAAAAVIIYEALRQRLGGEAHAY